MEMPRTFERYQSPRTSKLEAHRGEIAELIRLNWPLRKVVEFLKEEHQLDVAYSRIWTFCRSRKIVKGRGEVGAPVDGNGEDLRTEPEASPLEPSSPAESAGTATDSNEDISGLLTPKEARSPFTKFRPQSKS